jgi:hypothetical protein
MNMMFFGVASLFLLGIITGTGGHEANRQPYPS